MNVDHVCIVVDESVPIPEVRVAVTTCDRSQFHDKMLFAPSFDGSKKVDYDGVLDSGAFLDLLQLEIAKVLAKSNITTWPSSGVCCYVDLNGGFITMKAPCSNKIVVGALRWK